jgi:hypothetical protein
VWILTKQFDLNHLQINPENPDFHGLEEEILQENTNVTQIWSS